MPERSRYVSPPTRPSAARKRCFARSIAQRCWAPRVQASSGNSTIIVVPGLFGSPTIKWISPSGSSFVAISRTRIEAVTFSALVRAPSCAGGRNVTRWAIESGRGLKLTSPAAGSAKVLTAQRSFPHACASERSRSPPTMARTTRRMLTLLFVSSHGRAVSRRWQALVLLSTPRISSAGRPNRSGWCLESTSTTPFSAQRTLVLYTAGDVESTALSTELRGAAEPRVRTRSPSKRDPRPFG